MSKILYWYSCYAPKPKSPVVDMAAYMQTYATCAGPYSKDEADKYSERFTGNDKYLTVQVPVMRHFPANIWIARQRAVSCLTAKSGGVVPPRDVF